MGSIAASFDYGLNAAATEYDGKNKYLRITDIDDATHEFLKSDLTTPLADLAISADYLLEEGDLLFARTGASVGKTYLYRQYDGTVYFAGFLIRARIEESADPEFVYQATLTDAYKKYVAITSQRSGQPGVNAQEYADYQLMLPSRTEQQQIGMTLRSLDNLITLHQRKCRYRGLCGYLSWEQRKLGEFGSVAMCKRIYKEQTSEQGDVPFFKIGTFGADPDAFISNELFDYFKRTYPYPTPGTLLISAAGSIGRVVEYQGEKAYFQDSNIVWLEHDHRLNDTFLKPLYSQIEWGLEGSTIKRLYNKDLLSAEVTIPGSGEQKEIGRFFAKLDDLITLHQREPRFADTG